MPQRMWVSRGTNRVQLYRNVGLVSRAAEALRSGARPASDRAPLRKASASRLTKPQLIESPAMHVKWASVWRWAKIALAVAIVGGVGWQFAKILKRPELWEQPLVLDPVWVAVAGV